MSAPCRSTFSSRTPFSQRVTVFLLMTVSTPEAGSSTAPVETSMPQPAVSDLQIQLEALTWTGPERASRLVDLILRDAVRRTASDVHLEPTHSAVEVRYRLDGVLGEPPDKRDPPDPDDP